MPTPPRPQMSVLESFLRALILFLMISAVAVILSVALGGCGAGPEQIASSPGHAMTEPALACRSDFRGFYDHVDAAHAVPGELGTRGLLPQD